MWKSFALALLLIGGPSPLVVVNTPAGKRVIEVAPSGNDLTVTYDGGVLHGKFRGDKRKYESVEVKFSGEGFKVRTLDGKLLWKVKITPEKIKVGNNEENNNPFELKIKDGKVKVYAPGERLLGEVRVRGDHVDIGGKYIAAGTRPDAFYGVVMLDAVPTPQRAVIFAELAVRR
jgi:hypothetical protein